MKMTLKYFKGFRCVYCKKVFKNRHDFVFHDSTCDMKSVVKRYWQLQIEHSKRLLLIK